MFKPFYLWILLPYVFVFYGIYIMHSAWGAIIGFHLTLLPVIAPHWKELIKGFLIPVQAHILLGVMLGGVLGGVGVWLFILTAGPSIEIRENLEALGLSGAAWLPFILYFSVVNPWLEEAYWRYLLVDHFRYPAFIDLLFAGYHLIILSKFISLSWMFSAFLILLLISWFWRQVTIYTKSLLPVSLAHMLADVSILTVVYFFAGYSN